MPSGVFQLVIYYANGSAETYALQDVAPTHPLRSALLRQLQQPWLLLDLPDETVLINTSQVTHLEVRPATANDGVSGIPAERVTALSRVGR